jgi:aryl-alcohol dehydrogenase-like predicted oxidoreductase
MPTPTNPAPTPDTPIALPGCDVSLSVMGLGTWAWGDRSTWGMNGYDRSYDFETIRAAYERTVSAGIRLLDTAEAYGNGESERIIGRLLREDAANRGRMVVATKFMPFPWRLPLAAALMKSVRASLARLGLPFIHLYQVHGPISLRSPRAMAAALAAPHREGLIKAVGVSNYSESEMRAIHRALAAHGIPLATNQVEYSLLRTMPDANGLLRACRELGVMVLAYSPLAIGAPHRQVRRRESTARQAQLLRLSDGRNRAGRRRAAPHRRRARRQDAGTSGAQLADLQGRGADPRREERLPSGAERRRARLATHRRRGRGARSRRQVRPARPLPPRLAARLTHARRGPACYSPR